MLTSLVEGGHRRRPAIGLTGLQMFNVPVGLERVIHRYRVSFPVC